MNEKIIIFEHNNKKGFFMFDEKEPNVHSKFDARGYKVTSIYNASKLKFDLIALFNHRQSDALYENVLIKRYGEDGLYLLKALGYVECCGNINGERLYAMVVE